MALLHAYCAAVARGNAAPIAAKFARARKDPIGALIAGMCEAGLNSGGPAPSSQIDGLERLSDRDRALFHAPRAGGFRAPARARWRRRRAARSARGLDSRWSARARTPRASSASCPRAAAWTARRRRSRNFGSPRPWIAITKKGERAKHQPDPKDKAGLDPHKARVRMIQVYSPEHEAVFLFDLDHLTIETLAELGLFNNRKFVAHNAAFEFMMLRAHEHGIELIDSMQLASLALGCEFGARTLANVADQILEIELLKDQQLVRLGRPVPVDPAGQLRGGRRCRVPPGGARDVAAAEPARSAAASRSRTRRSRRSRACA